MVKMVIIAINWHMTVTIISISPSDANVSFMLLEEHKDVVTASMMREAFPQGTSWLVKVVMFVAAI